MHCRARACRGYTINCDGPKQESSNNTNQKCCSGQSENKSFKRITLVRVTSRDMIPFQSLINSKSQFSTLVFTPRCKHRPTLIRLAGAPSGVKQRRRLPSQNITIASIFKYQEMLLQYLTITILAGKIYNKGSILCNLKIQYAVDLHPVNLVISESNRLFCCVLDE